MIALARVRLRPALVFAWIALLAAMAMPMLGWSQSANDDGPVGLLLASGEGGRVTAPLLATDYDITVSGPAARTRVTQRFTNPTDRWVEGVYVFPLPEKAAVDTLTMVIGTRVVVGEIKEKVAARRTYEEAAAAGQRASLVEQHRPNVFSTSVANIGPGESVVVQIEYQETVRQDAGRYSLRVPLVVAPRYTPPAIRQEASADALSGGWATGEAWQTVPVRDPAATPPGNPVTLQVRLQAGFPVEAVESPYHKVAVRDAGDDVRLVALADGEVPADRDFELVWRPKTGAVPTIGLFRERVGDADYLLAMVVPPVAATAEKRPAREAIFVIDTSGSMSGPSIEQARAALLAALDGLREGDRFNVIRFASDASALFRAPAAADAANVARARDWVARLTADGGTEMVPALGMALADNAAERRGTVRQVIFLTDGAIGNENQVFDLLAQERGRSRVFMVGIGSAPNSHLMARAAEIGRGTFTHIGSTGEVEAGMRALFAKLESPVVTGLAVRFADAGVAATPDPVPDLYAGEPVVLLARAPALAGDFTLAGSIGRQPWSATLPTTGVQEGSGIAKLWARRRIDNLEAAAILGEIDNVSRDRDILSLALEHHLVTRLTSLVAVDRAPARPEDEVLERTDVPLNLPAGWSHEKVFGRAMRQHAAAPAPMQTAALAVPTQPMSLPQTATPAALLTAGGLVVALGGLALLLVARRRGGGTAA
ncbi:MAG: marine proteobacterial sortase target protein [Alphaproteobacteria bacterium]